MPKAIQFLCSCTMQTNQKKHELNLNTECMKLNRAKDRMGRLGCSSKENVVNVRPQKVDWRQVANPSEISS